MMAFQGSFLEDDLRCVLCCDVFTDPVLLECSHSYCRHCLEKCWSSGDKMCPICRRLSQNDSPPCNLALKNIVENYLREKALQNKNTVWESSERRRGESVEREEGGPARCSLHGERLLLFCMVDEEVVCVVCQASKKHKDHRMSPVDEAAEELKVELTASLKPLKEKLDVFQKVKDECFKTAQHIRKQANETEAQIRREFEELHHFLRLEEAVRIKALQHEAELKSVIMKEKMEYLSRKIECLSSTITAAEKEVCDEHVSFLQAYKNHKNSCSKSNQQEPVLVTDVVIDVAKHLGNLKFKVLQMLQEKVQFSPVILDPNTAAPWLKLSEDLTSVQHVERQEGIPNNPERYDQCVCVLGSQAIGGGTHSWEVGVSGKTKWDLGVVKESADRKGIVKVNSTNGYWALALIEGNQYHACTQPWTRIDLRRKPRRFRICLDYDAGTVSFYDPASMMLIHTFNHSFTEKLIPFFSPCVSGGDGNAAALTVLPVRVSVSVSSDVV